jgi:hypothetical protein
MSFTRHCEGDRPKQSINNQYHGLLHSVRNDESSIFWDSLFIPMLYILLFHAFQ